MSTINALFAASELAAPGCTRAKLALFPAASLMDPPFNANAPVLA